MRQKSAIVGLRVATNDGGTSEQPKELLPCSYKFKNYPGNPVHGRMS